MRLLRPGKIAASVVPESSAPRLGKRAPVVSKEREIWDDYLVNKKAKKKKEYERTPDGRMILKPQEHTAQSRDTSEANGAFDDRPSFRTDYGALEERLNYSFSDRELLVRALTHRSALGLRERLDYERLEFLGDAVLDLSIAHLLSEKHPNAREGDLSKMRAALVNTAALADIAKGLDIGPFIRLGRGEASSGGFERPSILADVMEAICGAMYLDSNYDRSFAIIADIFNAALEVVTPSDPKTELQEALHVCGSEPPNYLVEMVEGPEHAPTFVTVVIVDGEIVGRGRGATKKAAQQVAAAETLSRLFPAVESITLKDGQTVLIANALLTLEAARPKQEELPPSVEGPSQRSTLRNNDRGGALRFRDRDAEANISRDGSSEGAGQSD